MTLKEKLEAAVGLKNHTTDFVKYPKITVPPKIVTAGTVPADQNLFKVSKITLEQRSLNVVLTVFF